MTDKTEAARLADALEWRPIAGYEGVYEVSSAGDVRSIKSGKTLAKNLMGAGYIKADLWKDGRRLQTSIHRLVAKAFLGLRDGLEVNHINGNKTDNRRENLEVVSRSQNTIHSIYVLDQLRKPVVATNLGTGQTTTFRSVEEAARSGFSARHISACCHGRRRTHMDHEFRFAT